MNLRDTTQENSTLWSVDAIESIDFIQKANIETFKDTVLGLIGNAYDATKVYVLWGCVNTGSGTTYTISAGAVFYGGGVNGPEIYTTPAVSFTAATGTAVGTITQTGTGNILFSDNSTKNILLVRQMVIADGASGSGTSGTNGDYANWVSLTGLLRQGNIVRQIDVITTGNIAHGVNGVIHNITPAAFDIKNLKIDYCINIIASSDAEVVFQLYKNPTIVGGNVTGGIPLMTVTDRLIAAYNNYGVISFTTMIDYTANDVLVITGNSAKTDTTIENQSNLIIDGFSA